MKATRETIDLASQMLSADPPAASGAIKAELMQRFSMSKRTAATVLAKAKKERVITATLQDDLFPDMQPDFAPVDVVGSPAEETQRLYNPDGPLPDAESVRNMLKASCLNLINATDAYAKDIIAATRELSRLYKLDDPPKKKDELTPKQADAMLAAAMTELFGMEGAFFLPPAPKDDDGSDAD